MRRHRVPLTFVFAVVWSSLVGRAQPPEQGQLGLKWIPITDRMVIVQGVLELNLLAIDAGSHVVVVDTLLFPEETRLARALIERHFGKTVSHVINTHHHWDHTFGNQAFADATIVANRLTRDRMAAEYGPPHDMYRYYRIGLEQADRKWAPVLERDARRARLVVPTQTYDRKMRLRVDSLDVDLYHSPGLHTDNFTVVSIPALKTVVTRSDFAPGQRLEFEGAIRAEQLYEDHLDILRSSGGIDVIVQGHGEWFRCRGHDLKIGELKRLAGR
jgi:glyoxylase-like metal-dependent hydrolase (beta-lactamase superfamily II)